MALQERVRFPLDDMPATEIESLSMKINVAVQIDANDGSTDEMVLNNLRDVGFVEGTDADGNACLTFEGDISVNDLAYGASMFKSMRGR